MRRRQKLGPKIFFALLFWLGWVYLVLRIPPDKFYLLVLFFFLFFIASGLTFSLILKNRLYGFLFAAIITVFLLLRILKMANILNLVLLSSLGLTLILFFWSPRHKRKLPPQNFPQP
ncbi:hypothetical protein HY439_02655 [Candidatus Microgenomates bacterium]|nr:hypothetical protein [Candidatus Microgenomates bacterium]